MDKNASMEGLKAKMHRLDPAPVMLCTEIKETAAFTLLQKRESGPRPMPGNEQTKKAPIRYEQAAWG